MANINLNHISLNARNTDPPRSAPQWRTGQTLLARIETDSDARGAVTLRIGTHRLHATSPLPLRAGETLNLRVRTPGTTPVLQILTAATDLHRAAADQLRRTLPREGSLRPLLDGLSQLRDSPDLPRPIRSRLDALQRALPTITGLRAPGVLQQALLDSGTAFESRLAAAATAARLGRERGGRSGAGADFKEQLLRLRGEVGRALDEHRPPAPAVARGLAALVELYRRGRATPARLAATLRQQLGPAELRILIEALTVQARGTGTASIGTLPEPVAVVVEALQRARDAEGKALALLRRLRGMAALHDLSARIDSALNRIVTTQLVPLARDTSEPALWLVDLPVQLRDENTEVRMRFERRAAERDDAGAWSVRLEFDLGGLGRLRADVGLQHDNVSARFTADRPRTAENIREHLPVLAEALASAGIPVQRLEVGQGRIEADPGVRPDSPLLDERA